MNVQLVWNNRSSMDLSDSWIKACEQALALAAEQEGISNGEVALSFVDNEEIRQLNRDYRGIDETTDVLSFPMDDGTSERFPEVTTMLGDIVIAVPVAKEQSEAYGHSLLREIAFLFVHSFLHLIGYDHQTQEQETQMMEKQEAILAQIGLVR